MVKDDCIFVCPAASPLFCTRLNPAQPKPSVMAFPIFAATLRTFAPTASFIQDTFVAFMDNYGDRFPDWNDAQIKGMLMNPGVFGPPKLTLLFKQFLYAASDPGYPHSACGIIDVQDFTNLTSGPSFYHVKDEGIVAGTVRNISKGAPSCCLLEESAGM